MSQLTRFEKISLLDAMQKALNVISAKTKDAQIRFIITRRDFHVIDRMCERNFEENGYIVLVFWESDIKSNIELIERELKCKLLMG